RPPRPARRCGRSCPGSRRAPAQPRRAPAARAPKCVSSRPPFVTRRPHSRVRKEFLAASRCRTHDRVRSDGREPMSLEDKFACAEVIQAWGFARDQGRWPELLATFHPDGEIAVSWFKGAFPEFVERCKRNMQSGGGRSKHLLWPSSVRVAGDRALAETNVAIMVRQTIDG